jgi:hypothetical protein
MVGESGAGGTFGHIGWDDASNYLYLGHSYNSAFNKNLVIDGSGKVGIGTSSPSGRLSIEGGTATSEQSHITFENTAGAKKFAIGGGQSGVTNNGFVIRNVTDGTFPLVISDAGATTFSSTLSIGDDFLAESSASIDSTVRATGNNTRALGHYQAHTSGGDDVNMTLGVFGDASRGELSTATNHTLRLYVNNTPSKYLEIATTGQIYTSHGMVINEDSNDSDFRVESNGYTHTLFVDAGNDRAAIGTGAPQAPFVISQRGEEGFEFTPDVAANIDLIKTYDRDSSVYDTLRLDSLAYQFYISGSEKLRINSDGELGVGTSNPQSRIDAGGGYLANERGRTDHVSNTMPSPYYHFDGSDDNINLGTMSSYNTGTGDWSLLSSFINTGDDGGSNYLFDAYDASQGIQLRIGASGTLYSYMYDGVGSYVDLTGVTDVGADNKQHVAVMTCDRDSATGFNMYLDGVLDNTANPTSISGDVGNGSVTKYIGSDNNPLHGSIYRTLLFNLALTADEVKYFSSGGSVPFKYKGASQTELVSGTCASRADPYDYDTFDGASATGFHAIANHGGQANGGSADVIPLVKGKSYLVTFDAVLTSGETPQIFLSDSYGHGVSSNVETIAAGANSFILTSTITVTGVVQFLVHDNTEFTISNLSCVRAGAVAEYDGSSATSSTWYDKSGNDLDGTVTGATLENKVEALEVTGNLLVGATSVGAVGHSIRGNDSAIFNRDASGETVQVKRKATSGENVRFYNGASNVGNISTTSSATAYNTSSDYRLKENVDYTWDATTRLKQLKPARFNFIADDTNTLVDGFIAHEVSDIVPEAISGEKDAMMDEEYEVTPAVKDEDGNIVTEAVMGTRSVPDHQGIDQSKLVPLLVKTIQELEARITTLENA